MLIDYPQAFGNQQSTPNHLGGIVLAEMAYGDKKKRVVHCSRLPAKTLSNISHYSDSSHYVLIQ